MSGDASAGGWLMYNGSVIQSQALDRCVDRKAGLQRYRCIHQSQIASRGGFDYRIEVGWLD